MTGQKKVEKNQSACTQSGKSCRQTSGETTNASFEDDRRTEQNQFGCSEGHLTKMNKSKIAYPDYHTEYKKRIQFRMASRSNSNVEEKKSIVEYSRTIYRSP